MHTGMAALGTALTTSGVAGWHMTASIGGADMVRDSLALIFIF